MIHYQELVFNETEILSLYKANEWTNYTNNPDKLFNGIKNSLYTYGAYLNSKLIGLIRVVGDNNTIIYIQDILVNPQYQHQGIGTELVNHIISKYSHVRQIVLITDDTKKQLNFYKKSGFLNLKDINCNGFYYIKK